GEPVDIANKLRRFQRDARNIGRRGSR
ncbi:MAG: hypothetical protein QOG80_3533, partial [Pseudonocardiales bacterium]|nr:hypothetical protein [Pseudonocardiales bacterium]